MNAWVLEIGRPIGIVTAVSATLSTSYQQAKVVHSVGPYAFSNRSGGVPWITALIVLTSTASPPTSKCLIELKLHGASRASRLNNVVVRNRAVISCSRISVPKSTGESTTSRLI